MHKNRELIISYIDSRAKPNLLLLPNIKQLDAYACPIMVIELVNSSLTLRENLYKLHHDDLFSDSSLNLGIAGTYHYQVLAKSRVSLCFVNSVDSPLCLTAKTIAGTFIC